MRPNVGPLCLQLYAFFRNELHRLSEIHTGLFSIPNKKKKKKIDVFKKKHESMIISGSLITSSMLHLTWNVQL